MLSGLGIKIINVQETEDGFFDADIEIPPEFQKYYMEKMDWIEWDDIAFSHALNDALLEFVNRRREKRGEDKIVI
jgi:hypothetical protein